MNGDVRVLAIPPPGAYCVHETVDECHPGCGHWSCQCGVSWDDWGEGSPFFEDDHTFEEAT